MAIIVLESTHHYDASLKRLWPLLSDSSLLAEVDGQPPYVAVDELQPDGSVIRRAKGVFGPPVPAEWTEDLGEWVFHRYVRQVRRFTKGAFIYVDFMGHVSPLDDGFKLHLRIEMEIFVAMAFGASLFLALNMQFKLYPTYKGLLSLIEQNVPESRDAIQVVSDAVQSLNDAKSGT